jgi:hypothetical protein
MKFHFGIQKRITKINSLEINTSKTNLISEQYQTLKDCKVFMSVSERRPDSVAGEQEHCGDNPVFSAYINVIQLFCFTTSL